MSINNYPNITFWLNKVKEQFTVDEWEDVMEPFFSWKNSHKIMHFLQHLSYSISSFYNTALYILTLSSLPSL